MEQDEWTTVSYKKPKSYVDIGSTSRAAYKIKAIKWIKENKSFFTKTTHDHMVCVMFYAKPAGEIGYHDDISHSPKDVESALKHLREDNGVSTKKETVCAEEHMLINHPKIPFLFSISYKREFGFCRACLAGCSKMLAGKGIEDLHDDVKGFV